MTDELSPRRPDTAQDERSGPGARALWTGGGVALIVLGAVLLFVAQSKAPEFSDDMRLYLTIVLRGAVFLMLSFGTYCVVRGRRRV
ncbi:hypothetical protein [Streptomyces sp. TRM64462]|uniref:hypothetical protein n=1 Tax=Streptomyces sp. TRM64462 TaxID=2741726 RepID=UPI0015863749|nr:hypothetical protein [Streptomyces sp. TRM64462]